MKERPSSTPELPVVWSEVRYESLRKPVAGLFQAHGVVYKKGEMGAFVVLEDNRGNVHLHHVLDSDDFFHWGDHTYQVLHYIWSVQPTGNSTGWVHTSKLDAEAQLEIVNRACVDAGANYWSRGDAACYQSCEMKFEIKEEWLV